MGSDHKCKEKDVNGNCKSCKDGYYLYNDNCKKCNDNCKTCKSDNVCYSCIEFYTVQNGLCEPICGKNCIGCLSEIKCSGCKNGYYGDTCLNKCDKNCKSCTQYGCDACKRGYYLDLGGNCFNCPKGCSSCLDGGNCESCSAFYKLSGTICVRDASFYGVVIGIPLAIILIIALIIIICKCCCKAVVAGAQLAVRAASTNNQNTQYINAQAVNIIQSVPNSNQDLENYKLKSNNVNLSNPIKIKVSFLTGKKISVDTFKNELLGAVVARIEEMNVNLNLYDRNIYDFRMCSINGTPLDLNKTIEENSINEKSVVNYVVKGKMNSNMNMGNMYVMNNN